MVVFELSAGAIFGIGVFVGVVISAILFVVAAVTYSKKK